MIAEFSMGMLGIEAKHERRCSCTFGKVTRTGGRG